MIIPGKQQGSSMSINASDSAFSSIMFTLNFESKVIQTQNIIQQVMKMILGFVGQWVEMMATVRPQAVLFDAMTPLLQLLSSLT